MTDVTEGVGDTPIVDDAPTGAPPADYAKKIEDRFPTEEWVVPEPWPDPPVQPDDEPPHHARRWVGWIGPTAALTAMGCAVIGFTTIMMERVEKNTAPVTVNQPPIPITITQAPAPVVTSTLIEPPSTVTAAPKTVTQAPRPAPTTVTVQPGLPGPPTDYDQRFVARIRTAGWVEYDQSKTLYWAHRACELMRTDHDPAKVDGEMAAESGGDMPSTIFIVDNAQAVYPDCA